jgi:hypothetical protein
MRIMSVMDIQNFENWDVLRGIYLISLKNNSRSEMSIRNKYLHWKQILKSGTKCGHTSFDEEEDFLWRVFKN